MDLFLYPIKHIIEFIQNNSITQDAIFFISELQYDYQKQINIRKYVPTPASEISVDWLQKRLDNLPEGYELCFHSKIQISDTEVVHIPMIDFNVSTFEVETQEIIKERVNKQKDLAKFIPIYEEMKIYSSGRSFHGYGNRLLTEEEWREYMISLLLLNYTKNVNEYSNIVDTRWVAHRLLEGFSGLRWSCNTGKSLQYATLTDKKMLID